MATQKEIYDFLMANLQWRKSASGGKQIVTLCPNPSCNDKSGHFYIGPFNGTTDPIRYNCFKCGMKGLFSEKTLDLLGIAPDPEFNKSLKEFNDNTPKYSMNKTASRIITYRLQNDYITACPMSELKLKYINDRIGASLSYQDITQLKIVLNLYDVLGRNYIQETTRDPRIVEQLNNFFIGFVGADNNYLNMRRALPGVVNPSIDARYINYYLRPASENCKYYIIPTQIDMTSPEPIQVHLAEGPFDILGIYFNVMHQSNYRCIYMAIGGKGYATALEFIITKLGLTNVDLHIYPDLDIGTNSIIELVEWLKPFNFNITSHRNLYKDPESQKQEKDFGVPASRIITGTEIIQKRMESF
ncbi:MAG: hypothetical protein J6Y02_09940 [Pseudobutyrivibrio sp.]|nr:hypothetical protein [Pseudobutyrivibrio sp.]